MSSIPCGLPALDRHRGGREEKKILLAVLRVTALIALALGNPAGFRLSAAGAEEVSMCPQLQGTVPLNR